MPTNPYTLPVVSADAIAYQVAEESVDTGYGATSKLTASTPGTTNVTLTAKKIGARVLFSEEMAEDSIVPIMPFVKSTIATAMAYGIENYLINADQSTTPLDSDNTVSTSVIYRYGNALRRYAHIGNQNVDLGTLNGVNLMSLRAKMGKYGVNPNDLVMVTSVAGYMKMLRSAGHPNPGCKDAAHPRRLYPRPSR